MQPSQFQPLFSTHLIVVDSSDYDFQAQFDNPLPRIFHPGWILNTPDRVSERASARPAIIWPKTVLPSVDPFTVREKGAPYRVNVHAHIIDAIRGGVTKKRKQGHPISNFHAEILSHKIRINFTMARMPEL